MEVVDPIVLDVRVVEEEKACRCCCCCCDIPEAVTGCLNGGFSGYEPHRFLSVSLGVFSVIRIVRPAEYLVQATEYSVPDKECVAPQEDDPCGMFRTMAFPTHEFSPVGIPPASCHSSEGKNRCGC